MKVKYLQSMAGDRFVRVRGESYEIDDKEAKSLIAAGFVEKVEDQQPVDSETKKPKGK